ncbi:MAG: hypothetical protein LBB34_01085 [Holosporales bacterium]|jgi:hypothetical protein|nr:hypothetical protein [Holosporales bacterium]
MHNYGESEGVEFIKSGDNSHTVTLRGDNSLLSKATFRVPVVFDGLRSIPIKTECSSGAEVASQLLIPDNSNVKIHGGFSVKKGARAIVKGNLYILKN